jgi:hypothetical protein
MAQMMYVLYTLDLLESKKYSGIRLNFYERLTGISVQGIERVKEVLKE